MDPNRPNVMETARAKAAGLDPDAPATARPRRIDGSVEGVPPLPPLNVTIPVVIGCVFFLAWGLWVLAQGAPPPLPASAPASAPAAAQEPAQEAPAPAAPTEPAALGVATLAAEATAYAAPAGAVLGPVGGRPVLAVHARLGVGWLQVELPDAGVVWVPMGAMAGQPVDLAQIPDLAPPQAAPVAPAEAAPAVVAPAPAPTATPPARGCGQAAAAGARRCAP